MADFKVNILGCGSATPSLRHMPSCQVVDHRDRLMMVDCGEGAQLAMRRMRLKYSRLNNIFISHLHGDHFLGLPGLLSTMALHENSGRVNIYCFPAGIELLRRTLAVFCRETPFEIVYHPIEPGHATILDTHALTVETFPLYHRVPAVGFLLREKPKPRHIDGDSVRFFGVPVAQMQAIRAGADFLTPDGRVIPNARLTRDPDPTMSYAYCSDTAYDERVAAAISGVDTIYHESTYLEDNAQKASERGHSTAAEAGRIATLAGARRLILGHYSKRYDDDQPFAAEAARTFRGEIIAATEGMRIDLL